MSGSVNKAIILAIAAKILINYGGLPEFEDISAEIESFLEDYCA